MLAWSVKGLADRWGWSRSKVTRFLKLLENEHQIEHQTNTITTLITIINYDKYQDKDIKTNIKRTSNEHQTNTSKESKELKNKSNGLVGNVIEYLNQRTGKSFKPNSSKTQNLILARKNEGFTLENFKTVIDIKSESWSKDSNMGKYLRPETLFGTKFESYLNEKQENKKVIGGYEF